jgi:hypothetical protein
LSASAILRACLGDGRSDHLRVGAHSRVEVAGRDLAVCRLEIELEDVLVELDPEYADLLA